MTPVDLNHYSHITAHTLADTSISTLTSNVNRYIANNLTRVLISINYSSAVSSGSNYASIMYSCMIIMGDMKTTTQPTNRKLDEKL